MVIQDITLGDGLETAITLEDGTLLDLLDPEVDFSENGEIEK